MRIGARCGRARACHGVGGHGVGGHGGGGQGDGDGPASKPVPGARVSLSNGQGVRGTGKPLSKKVGVRGICHHCGSFQCDPGMT
jgi:hypothetical protein